MALPENRLKRNQPAAHLAAGELLAASDYHADGRRTLELRSAFQKTTSPRNMSENVGVDVETLEAALAFISQYELPASAGDGLTGATVAANAPSASAINLTRAFKHSHSLEITNRMLKHSHSLEIPDQAEQPSPSFELEDSNSSDFSAFLDGFDDDEDMFREAQAPAQIPNNTEMQDVLPLSVRPHLPDISGAFGGVSTAAAPIPSAWKPQRSSRRPTRREELIDLRDTVSVLSDKLDRLQTASLSPPASPCSRDANLQVESLLLEPESLWQKVAARQLVLRQNSEAANVHLRNLVDVQVRKAKNLKRMLHRRSDGDTVEMLGLKRQKHMTPRSPPNDNVEVFEKLLRDTDELYVDIDKLFTDIGMEQVPCPGHMRRVQRNAVNGTFVEFLDKNRVPFSLQKTEKAVWKQLRSRHRNAAHGGPYTQGKIDFNTQQTDDTVTNYICFTCSAGAVSALLQVREVARRYATEDCATFICRSVMEPTPTGEEGAAGLKFHETISVVVKRGEPLASGQETTIIESHLCATRQEEGIENALKFREAAYVDIAIDGWEHSLSVSNQRIENLLFEEAISAGK